MPVFFYAKFDKELPTDRKHSLKTLSRSKTLAQNTQSLKTLSKTMDTLACPVSLVPPAPFTETEWQELEYECLTDQMTRQLINEIPEQQDILLQEHRNLTEVYNEMIKHQESMSNADEWENMDGDITFGGHDSFSTQDYIHLWDEQEMLYDMNAFESDVHAQVYLANHPKNQCDTTVTLSTQGPNYSTGESLYGKVYIPKHLTPYLQQSPQSCRIIYNGCEDARQSANIRMPWKCIFVNVSS